MADRPASRRRRAPRGIVEPSLRTEHDECVAAARSGDEDAYEQLVAAHRSEIQAHCYRMLASLPDAEDAVQETLLRAWRALPGFEGLSSFRTWLYRIATNVCLKAIERRPRRFLPVEHGPASEPDDRPGEPVVESIWIDPYPAAIAALDDVGEHPEARYERLESVELAFVAALQHLPARQRAVLILREVLGFSGDEVAEALETTPTAVYSALQRAHKGIDERLPERSQQATLRSLGDRDLRELAGRYVSAWESNDIPAILELLTDDAALAMPPRPTWYRGHEAIGAFLSRWPLSSSQRWRLVATQANGQLAFGSYLSHTGDDAFLAHGIDVLTLRGTRIEATTVFLDRELLPRFGLPRQIDP